MQSGSRKQIDIAHLKAGLTAAGVEILSAQCATDRLRLQYSPEEIVAFGDRSTLKKAIASSQAVYRFFSVLEVQIKHTGDSNR